MTAAATPTAACPGGAGYLAKYAALGLLGHVAGPSGPLAAHATHEPLHSIPDSGAGSGLRVSPRISGQLHGLARVERRGTEGV
jgi:hypothetical protein